MPLSVNLMPKHSRGGAREGGLGSVWVAIPGELGGTGWNVLVRSIGANLMDLLFSGVFRAAQGVPAGVDISRSVISRPPVQIRVSAPPPRPGGKPGANSLVAPPT